VLDAYNNNTEKYGRYFDGLTNTVKNTATKDSRAVLDDWNGLVYYPTARGWQQDQNPDAAGYAPANKINMFMPPPAKYVRGQTPVQQQILGPGGSEYYPIYENKYTGVKSGWIQGTNENIAGYVKPETFNQFVQYQNSAAAPGQVKTNPLSKSQVQLTNPWEDNYQEPKAFQADVNNYIAQERARQQAEANKKGGGFLKDIFKPITNILGDVAKFLTIDDELAAFDKFVNNTVGWETVAALVGGQLYGPLGAALAKGVVSAEQGKDFGQILQDAAIGYAITYGTQQLFDAVKGPMGEVFDQSLLDGTIDDAILGDAMEEFADTVTDSALLDSLPDTIKDYLPDVVDEGIGEVIDQGIGEIVDELPVNNFPLPPDAMPDVGEINIDEFTPELPTAPTGPVNPDIPMDQYIPDTTPVDTVTPDVSPDLFDPELPPVPTEVYVPPEAVAPGEIIFSDITGQEVELPRNPDMIQTGGTVEVMPAPPGDYTELPIPEVPVEPDVSGDYGNYDPGAMDSGVGDTGTGLTPEQLLIGGGAVVGGAVAAGGGATPSPAPAPGPVEPPPVTEPTPVPPGEPTPVPPVEPTPVPPVEPPPVVEPVPVEPPIVEPPVVEPVPVEPAPITPEPAPITPEPPPVVEPPVVEPPIPVEPAPVPEKPPVEIIDKSAPYTGEYSNQSVLERFMSGTITYGDVAKLVAAGYVLPSVLALIGGPPAAPGRRGYGPLAPIEWGTLEGGLTNPGLNPGFLTFGGSPPPAYQTTNPLQSQYYWGLQPYMQTQADLANYNQVQMPAVPFGQQQPRGAFDTQRFINETIGTPEYQQAAMGASTQYPGGVAPATSYQGGVVAPAPMMPTPQFTTPVPTAQLMNTMAPQFNMPVAPVVPQVNMNFTPVTVPTTLPEWAPGMYDLNQPIAPYGTTPVPVKA
jgi:hypothetical protein